MLFVRVRGNPDQVRLALLERLTGLDPAFGIMTLGNAMQMQTALLQIGFGLTVVLGGLALVLTVSGLFSVLSYLVEQQAKDIGVRMALGAAAHDVMRLVLSQSLRPVAIGLAAGAGLAVAVSAAGLYGVVAHSVAARTSEVGVRLALGSTPGRVVSLMMREGLLLAAVGIALGLCGAVAATRTIRTLLFGVPPTDPVSFVGAALLLLFVTVLATYLPARRAARVDPVVPLRAE